VIDVQVKTRMTSRRKLLLICISRFGTSVATMVYAGSLPYLLDAWNMTAAQAGSVQSTYNIAYALSLLIASWLSDRIGAKVVYLASVWSAAVAFLGFAFGARSYESALILVSIVAITQGGTYTPSIMLVADEFPSDRRGWAIGAIQAAASLGYLFSIVLSIGGASLVSYVWGFYASAVGPLVGAIAGAAALTGTPKIVHRRVASRETAGSVRQALMSRRSILLTVGYTAHAWELLGMWAWTPTFLAVAFRHNDVVDSPVMGLWIAVPIHLAGFVATLTMGQASDRWGRRGVLVSTALSGAVLSFCFGWLVDLPLIPLLLIAFLYGFAVLGDSGVLSVAMTEAVHPQYLGTLLALRSILGFGAGALSPLVVGWILDVTNPAMGLPHTWGWGFMALGLGGALATLCALMLPGRESSQHSEKQKNR
jgi:MFS family permease